MALFLRDITERKRAELGLLEAMKRDAFRIKVADILREWVEPERFLASVCDGLSELLGVSRVACIEVRDEDLHVTAEHTRAVVPLPSHIPLHRVDAQLLDALRTGPNVAATELADGSIGRSFELVETLQEEPGEVRVIIRREQEPAAFFIVRSAEKRKWLATDVALIEETSDRCWAAVERARALANSREGADALREADRRKNEFLAVLSHELRNPLAPITSGLEVLDHEIRAAGRTSRALPVIRRQVTQLSRLVDDLLDLTRITRGKIELKPRHVELNQLLQETVEDHRAAFERRDVSLQFKESAAPLPITGDPQRLMQAFGNLLHNAAKFTACGGHTLVTADRDPQDPSWGVVRVTDTGAGIAADILAQLFQPFMQAESTLDRSKGGLGLGLALTRRLVDLHGGSVDAYSEGEGAEFVVRLPLQRESSPVSWRTPPAVVAPTRMSSFATWVYPGWTALSWPKF